MSEQSPRRRLAAILAADMVGYSRAMEADEEGTLARLAEVARASCGAASLADRGNLAAAVPVA